MPKEYLGDSVYADFDGFGIILTTENGYGPNNTIVLEPDVLAALNNYVERLKHRQPENVRMSDGGQEALK